MTPLTHFELGVSMKFIPSVETGFSSYGYYDTIKFPPFYQLSFQVKAILFKRDQTLFIHPVWYFFYRRLWGLFKRRRSIQWMPKMSELLPRWWWGSETLLKQRLLSERSVSFKISDECR